MLKFYRLKTDYFEAEKAYSFTIFLYEKERDRRIIALLPTRELTSEKLDEWREAESRGAYFQLFRDELKEFYIETEVTEEELIGQNEFYFRMYDLQQSRLEAYEEKSKETFLLRDTLRQIANTEDFMPLIEKVKSEVLCFPLYESDMVSICTDLVEKLFVRDIIPVRVAALSYMLAKQNKITDTNQLCIILTSALLKDLGFTMIRSSHFANFSLLQLEDIYAKHPMLSLYILSKVDYEFDKQIKRLILESHEQTDGSGFPRQKKEGHIDYISYIVNLCDQIIMYSGGKINGRKADLIKTIEIFHKSVSVEGLNVNFPQRLLESLGTLLLNDLEKELDKKSKHM